MNPFVAILSELSEGGYSVYTPILSSEKAIVIESPDGILSKVIFRVASITDSTPLISLSSKCRSSEYLRDYGYFMAIEPEEPKAWLIPVGDFPTNQQSIRLGSKFEQYVVRAWSEDRGVEGENLRRSIQSRIGGEGGIKQEDLESILLMNNDYD